MWPDWVLNPGPLTYMPRLNCFFFQGSSLLKGAVQSGLSIFIILQTIYDTDREQNKLVLA